MRFLFKTKLLVDDKLVEYDVFQKTILLYYAAPSKGGREFSSPTDFYIVKENDQWNIWNISMAAHEEFVGQLIEQFFEEG